MSKTVLITGCSDGGLGAAMAKVYRTKGFRVFATLRNEAKAGSLATLDGIEIVELEVTSVESIRQCAGAVAKRTGGTLDVLVNNAGVNAIVPLLDASLDDAKKVYDTNVWSILAMAQAFAPMLIKARGIMCNISSVSSEMVFAWAGMCQTLSLVSCGPSANLVQAYTVAPGVLERGFPRRYVLSWRLLAYESSL